MLNKIRFTSLAICLTAIVPIGFTAPGDVAPLGARDGKIDTGDALVTQRMANGDIAVDMAANQAPIGAPDGVVNTNDTITILRAALGIQLLPNPSLENAVEAGLRAIINEDFQLANAHFNAAVAAIDSQASNDADTAYFFRALTLLAAYGENTASDGLPGNGLQRIGDVLDAIGCQVTPRDKWDVFCPDILPANSPTGEDAQAFLYGPIKDKLTVAIADLDKIDTSFRRQWQEVGSTLSGTEYDYSDVLLIRAACKALLSQLAYQRAYDLGGDIDQELNNPRQWDTILANHPDLFTLANGNKLTEASDFLDAGLADLDAAIRYMLSETDYQGDDFIYLEGVSASEIQEALEHIDLARRNIAGETRNNSINGSDYLITVKNFYTNFDIRNQMPLIIGDKPAGFFPDPTLNGILGGAGNINTDLNTDGIPDVLQPDIFP